MSAAEKRRYDSTVARIAGNIAAAYAVNVGDLVSLTDNKREIDGLIRETAKRSVQMARAIVAEVERTEVV